MFKLKPCPFCGKEPDVMKSTYGFSVDCRNGLCPCMPNIWTYDTEEEAIMEWNIRRG